MRSTIKIPKFRFEGLFHSISLIKKMSQGDKKKEEILDNHVNKVCHVLWVTQDPNLNFVPSPFLSSLSNAPHHHILSLLISSLPHFIGPAIIQAFISLGNYSQVSTLISLSQSF